MDPRRFDSLTRSLAAPRSRRGFLGSLAALAAGFAGRPAGAQGTQAQCGNVVCASNPGTCAPGCVCCVYPNGNSRCRPPQECTAPGTAVSPPTTTTTTTQAPTTTTVAPTTAAPTTTLPACVPTGLACSTGLPCCSPADVCVPAGAIGLWCLPAPTTTTTPPPNQGACTAGSTHCTAGGPPITCNGSPTCACFPTQSGATACVSVPSIQLVPCTNDTQCVGLHGPGAVCVTCNGTIGCGAPCPA